MVILMKMCSCVRTWSVLYYMFHVVYMQRVPWSFSALRLSLKLIVHMIFVSVDV